jgi:DNA-binding XRE family transcriptional regulator
MHLTSHVTVTVKEPKKKAKTFLVPATARKSVEKFLNDQLDFSAHKKTIAASKVLPELTDETLRPATILRASRIKADMTQKELAAKLGVFQHHLSEMENSKRPIGKQMAKKLSAVFKSDYRLFI